MKNQIDLINEMKEHRFFILQANEAKEEALLKVFEGTKKCWIQRMNGQCYCIHNLYVIRNYYLYNSLRNLIYKT